MIFLEGLITQTEMETIQAGETRTVKNSHLLDCLRRRNSVRVMWTVIRLLEGEHGKDKEIHEVILKKIAKGTIYFLSVHSHAC